jgi:hypothetical protein
MARTVTIPQMRARALDGHYMALRALSEGRPVLRSGAYASEIRGMRTILATLRRWDAIDGEGNLTETGEELLRLGPR